MGITLVINNIVVNIKTYLLAYAKNLIFNLNSISNVSLLHKYQIDLLKLSIYYIYL